MFTFKALLFSAPCFIVSMLHPLHVSVTEIEMKEPDKRLEIMVRIFMDDLESTLRETYEIPDLDILKPKNKTLDQMMKEYLGNHLKIELDGKMQVLDYLGHEDEGQAFIFYVEVNKVKKWKTIEVTNDIMMGTFRDQSNLVHVTVGETVKSLRMTRAKPRDKLTFED